MLELAFLIHLSWRLSVAINKPSFKPFVSCVCLLFAFVSVFELFLFNLNFAVLFFQLGLHGLEVFLVLFLHLLDIKSLFSFLTRFAVHFCLGLGCLGNGWWFLFACDSDFVDKYFDVHQFLTDFSR